MSKDSFLPTGRVLIVGLGNPGDKYTKTRHNIGFEVALEVARRANIAMNEQKFRAVIGTGSFAGRSASIVLPQTFMNLSGESVSPALGFWKLTPESVIALHDEIDLPPGRIRIKQGGGHGGHNGLRSLDAQLPNNNYFRIRLGVGRPAHPAADVAGYVLGRFAADEAAVVDRLVKSGADAVELLVTRGLLAAQGAIHPLG